MILVSSLPISSDPRASRHRCAGGERELEEKVSRKFFGRLRFRALPHGKYGLVQERFGMLTISPIGASLRVLFIFPSIPVRVESASRGKRRLPSLRRCTALQASPPVRGMSDAGNSGGRISRFVETVREDFQGDPSSVHPEKWIGAGQDSVARFELEAIHRGG